MGFVDLSIQYAACFVDSSVACCRIRIYMWIFLIPLMLYSTDLSEQFQTGDGGNTQTLRLPRHAQSIPSRIKLEKKRHMYYYTHFVNILVVSAQTNHFQMRFTISATGILTTGINAKH